METCDACGPAVRALVRFYKLEDRSQLDFCGHHSNKNRAELSKQGWAEMTLVQEPLKSVGVNLPEAETMQGFV